MSTALSVLRRLPGPALALWGLALVCAPASAQTATGSTFNFVVVMLDDLDQRSLLDLLNYQPAPHGAPGDLVPNLRDRIVADSVSFTSAFVTYPLCCPSRATFLTGKYAHNTGVKHNRLRDPGTVPGRTVRGAVAEFADDDTLATRLSAAGYTTGYVGKYLNGYGESPGLDDYTGIEAYNPAYVPPGWTQWHALLDPGTYCVYDYSIHHALAGEASRFEFYAGEDPDLASDPLSASLVGTRDPANALCADDPECGSVRERNYQTHVLARLGADFIREAAGKPEPFFLAMMPLTPHFEICEQAYGAAGLPENNYEMNIRPAPRDLHIAVPSFTDTRPASFDLATVNAPGWHPSEPLSVEQIAAVDRQYQNRLRALLAVDRMIGKLLDALADAPGGDVSANTVVVVTSDNGWLYGEHRWSGKRVPYDEAARVPLYIRHPGLPGINGSTRDAFVLNNDLAPTILDIAGLQAPADADGSSILPLLAQRGGGATVRTRFLIGAWDNGVDNSIGFFLPTYSALRTHGFLYVRPTTDRLYMPPDPVSVITADLELYDLALTPTQSINLYTEGVLPPPYAQLVPQFEAFLLGDGGGAGLVSCQGEQCRALEFDTRQAQGSAARSAGEASRRE